MKTEELIGQVFQKTRLSILITIFILFFLQEAMSDQPTPSFPGFAPPTPPSGGNRYTKPTTTQKRQRRTTPPRMSFAEDCDYLAYYCMKAYKTGVVCGRTMYYEYANFMTYCQLDYVNCMERYEVWQLAHMGECYDVKELTDYLHYEYMDDFFLDRDFVSDD